jgi:hypothetical protein
VGAIYGQRTTVSENNLIWFRADPLFHCRKLPTAPKSHSQCPRSHASVAPNDANAGRNERATRPAQHATQQILPFRALAGGIFNESENLSLADGNPTTTEYAIILAVVIIFAFATYELFGERPVKNE